MGRKCFVPRCNSGYDSCPDKVSLFSVPKDKVNEWQAIIPRSDRKLRTRDCVCEKHFLEEFIIREVITETYSVSYDAFKCGFYSQATIKFVVYSQTS